MSANWPEESMTIRVLVVEDERGLSDDLAHQLHALHCDYDLCRFGTEALERVMDFQPHVVLLDMQMRHESGYLIAAGIRLQRNPRQPLIVALTQPDADRPREKCEQVGVDLHLFRPVAHATLVAVLQEAGWQDRPLGNDEDTVQQ
jgi:CheY-like chemotaxis protein